MAGVVFEFGDAGVLEEAVVALEDDLDAVARVAAFDFAHASGEDEVAAIDKGDGVAEFFDLVHAVGGEEDGFALFAEVDERVHEEDGVDGIEAAEGLVHDDELGLVQECRDELDLLLHALGELFGLLGNGFGDLHALAPYVGALAGGGGIEAMELAEEDELVHDLHLFVETALFGEIADALEVFAAEGLPEEADGTRVWDGHADHHADGGGFSGAVGAEEAEHAPGLDGKAEVCDSDFGVVGLSDMLQFYDGHRVGASLSGGIFARAQAHSTGLTASAACAADCMNLSQLLVHGEEVEAVPGFDDVTVFDASHADAGEAYRFVGGGYPEALTLMCSGHDEARDGLVCFGYGVFDVYVKIGECGTEVGVEGFEGGFRLDLTAVGVG